MSALLQNGVKPLFVADGKLCPALKEKELSKRQQQRDKARGVTLSPFRNSQKVSYVILSIQSNQSFVFGEVLKNMPIK